MSKHLATVGMKTGSRRDSHLLWPIGGERMSAKFHGITSWDSCFWHRYFSLNQTGEHTDRQTKQAVSWAHKTKPLKKLYPIMGNSLISPVTEDKWKCSSDSAYWDDIIRLQSLKPECRWNNGRFQSLTSENWVRLHVNSATDEWTGWLWCCSGSHAFCPCIYSFMCEVIGSEIVRNTGITRRSGAVRWDGCKTSPLVLKSHTNTLRGGEMGVSRHPCSTYHAHTCSDVNEHTCMYSQKTDVTHKVKLYSQVSKCIHPTGLCSNQQD